MNLKDELLPCFYGAIWLPQPESKYESITYSKEVGCPTCRIGQEQINKFRFKGDPKPKKSHFTGLNWVFDQVFVREIVKNKFIEESVTGVNFLNVINHKTDSVIPEFYQLGIDSVLPISLLNNNITKEICEYPRDEKRAAFLESMSSNLVKGPFCGEVKINFPQGQKLKIKKEVFKRYSRCSKIK